MPPLKKSSKAARQIFDRGGDRTPPYSNVGNLFIAKESVLSGEWKTDR